MIEMTREADVFVLKMTAEENRFNPEMLSAFDSARSAVEAADGTAAVITGEGKLFSNGLDLEWMGANPERIGEVVNGLQSLYGRLLAFPATLVAAINGHAFAGGGMLALACDQRVMREDRGFFCLPEVDINIPFSAGMSALVQSKLTPQIAHEVMLTGRRYGGADAARVGIVDLCVAEDSVLPEAVGAAEALSKKSRDTVATIKRTMYSDALELLSEQVDLSGLG